jgi:hypothetical protein
MTLATKKDLDEAVDLTRDDEVPIYKLESVLDWLDHRKYHTKNHLD